MRAPQILEVVVFLMIAVAVLLPRPDVKVKPALGLGPAERDRLALLQVAAAKGPLDTEAALEMSDLLMDGGRPDWALSVITRALDEAPRDHRLHLRRAMALAERFETEPAFKASERALALCESSAGCSASEVARLRYLKSSLKSISGIDIRENANLAKERLIRGLRSTRLNEGPK